MIKRKSIGIIILNYVSYQDTINCIDSFKKAESKAYTINYVIVDNGSKNESYDILKNKYKNSKNIHILKLENNVGFAKGNNAGCKFLKEKFKCDYYIFSNSDILVPKNIFSWIDDTYINNDCDILGPDIYASKLGIHQNPIKMYTQNKTILNLKILKKKIEIILLRLKLINKKIVNDKKRKINSVISEKIFDYPVHGSFIISNSKIFNYYDDFFDNRTFLYMEEYLLYLRCKDKNIKTMVSLDNTVTHLQGKSTDTDIKDNRMKIIKRIKNEIASMIIYKNTLK